MKAGCRKSRRERHAMPFGDPHIEEPVREMLMESGKSCSVLHRSRDCHQTFILFPKIQHDFGKHIRVRIFRTLCQRLSRYDVKWPGSVEFRRILLCREVSFSFAGQHMKKHRPFHSLCFFERPAECFQVMPVHRS